MIVACREEVNQSYWDYLPAEIREYILYLSRLPPCSYLVLEELKARFSLESLYESTTGVKARVFYQHHMKLGFFKDCSKNILKDSFFKKDCDGLSCTCSHSLIWLRLIRPNCRSKFYLSCDYPSALIYSRNYAKKSLEFHVWNLCH